MTSSEYRITSQSNHDGGVNRPGGSLLVPLRGAGAFDSAFDILKSNFLPLFLITATILLPLHLAEQYVVSRWLDPGMAAAAANPNSDPASLMFDRLDAIWGYLPVGYPSAGVPGLLMLFFAFLASAPVSFAVKQAIAGEPIDVAACFKSCRRSIWSLMGVALTASLSSFFIWFVLTNVIFFGGAMILGLLALGLSGGADSTIFSWISAIYLLLLILVPYLSVCLFYGKIFAFCVPAGVNEQLSMMESITRSQELAKLLKTRTILMVFVLLPLVVLAVGWMLMYGVEGALPLLHLTPQWEFVAESSVCATVVCSLEAYWMVYIARLYFDQRVKRECLDIRMMLADGANG